MVKTPRNGTRQYCKHVYSHYTYTTKGGRGDCSVDDSEGEGSGANAEEFVFCDAVEDF